MVVLLLPLDEKGLLYEDDDEKKLVLLREVLLLLLDKKRTTTRKKKTGRRSRTLSFGEPSCATILVGVHSSSSPLPPDDDIALVSIRRVTLLEGGVRQLLRAEESSL
jgi:hypothetical protein